MVARRKPGIYCPRPDASWSIIRPSAATMGNANLVWRWNLRHGMLRRTCRIIIQKPQTRGFLYNNSEGPAHHGERATGDCGERAGRSLVRPRSMVRPIYSIEK